MNRSMCFSADAVGFAIVRLRYDHIRGFYRKRYPTEVQWTPIAARRTRDLRYRRG